MDLIKSLIRHYWANILATMVFGIVVIRYVFLIRGGEPWDESVGPLAFAMLGWVSVVASEEVSDWTGGYGWTRSQWRQQPVDWVKFVGGIMLTIAAIIIFLG